MGLLEAICFLLAISKSTSAVFEGYQVLRLHPDSNETAQAIFRLAQSDTNKFDIWKAAGGKNAMIDLMVSPTGLEDLGILLEQHHIRRETLITNLDQVLRSQQEAAVNQAGGEQYTYKTYEEIVMILESYQSEYSFVQLTDVGKTFENRSMYLLTIAKDDQKPAIWIEAGIHAREWISPASVLYFVDKLLASNESELLAKYQFIILAVFNPDGYIYTHTTYRLWRKNRRNNSASRCVGVDLNRNFPFHWGDEGGASADPCSEVYKGESGASEPETETVIAELRKNATQIELYLSVHSYGQFLLTPYGYSEGAYPENYENMIRMGRLIATALREKHQYVYEVGSVTDVLYQATGASIDFAAGDLHIPYSYTIELPDTGRYGFVLPPEFIPIAGEHIWTVINVFAEENAV